MGPNLENCPGVEPGECCFRADKCQAGRVEGWPCDWALKNLKKKICVYIYMYRVGCRVLKFIQGGYVSGCRLPVYIRWFSGLQVYREGV